MTSSPITSGTSDSLLQRIPHLEELQITWLLFRSCSAPRRLEGGRQGVALLAAFLPGSHHARGCRHPTMRTRSGKSRTAEQWGGRGGARVEHAGPRGHRAMCNIIEWRGHASVAARNKRLTAPRSFLHSARSSVPSPDPSSNHTQLGQDHVACRHTAVLCRIRVEWSRQATTCS